MFTLCIASIKLSILMLYKRLFPVRPMNIAVQAVALIVIVWATAVFWQAALFAFPLRSFGIP